MADKDSAQAPTDEESKDAPVSSDVEEPTTKETKTPASEDDVDPDDLELTDEQLEAAEDDAEENESEQDGKELEGSSEEEAPAEAEAKPEPVDEDSSEGVTTSEEEKSPARIAWEQREARRQALKQQQQQEYLESAEDEKDLALRQLQIEAYNNRVQSNINKLQNGIEKAVASIDLFRTGTPEQKEQLLREVDKFEALYVTKDQNGDPIEVRGDILQYLQNEAEFIRKLTGVGARQQAKDKSKTKAKTLTAPASKPKETPRDPEIDAFDEEANRW